MSSKNQKESIEENGESYGENSGVGEDFDREEPELETAAVEIVGKDITTEEEIRAVILNRFEVPREDIMEEDRNELVRRRDAEEARKEARDTGYEVGKVKKEAEFRDLIDERMEEIDTEDGLSAYEKGFKNALQNLRESVRAENEQLSTEEKGDATE